MSTTASSAAGPTTVPAQESTDSPARRAGMPRAAAVVAVAAWGIVVVAVVTLISARPPITEALWFFLVDAMVGCIYGLVAALVLSRRRHVVPVILAVTALGGAVTSFAFAYGALGRRRPDLPWIETVSSLNGVAWVPGTLALFLVVPWLVRDHRLGNPARAGLALGIVVCAWFTLSSALDLSVSLELLAGSAVVMGLVTAADVAWRWARGPVAERIGLGWLAVGVTIMSLSFVPLAVPAGRDLPIWSVPVLHLAAQAFFPAAVLVAVLRQRLWGIDLAVNRAVVAGVLTLVLVGLYLVVAAAITPVLPGDGAGRLVAAAAVVVAVQPSRLWLQARVRRLVHGEGAEPHHAVRRLGAQLGTADSARELLDGLVDSVAEALRLESVALVTDGTVVAARGTATRAATVVPLVHRGEALGELLVTAPPGESLGARAHRTLAELAVVVQAGVALARASSDLDAARERLTTVRLEERRVIRRELHDGLGPSLAGIRLGLQAARNLMADDPAAAGGLLASLQAELDHRVEDVRQLSRSLLPPVLDELGLGAAVGELAQRHRDGGMDVRLECDVTPDLPGPVAAAVYGIVAEAVTNVVRHGAARTCWVRVATDAEAAAVVAVVEDDGVGVDPAAPGGVGTRSMRERAREQGGTVEVEPRSPSGTRVRACIPVAARG